MQTVENVSSDKQTNSVCVLCLAKRDKIYPSNANRGVVENVDHLNQQNKTERQHPPNKMIKRYKIWEQRLDGYSQFHY